MKHQLCTLTAALLLSACSGGADQTAVDLPEGLTPVQPPIIDSVQLSNGERITFYDVTPPGDDSTAIMISQLGDNSLPEFQLQLEHRAQYPVSSAELWKEATGSSVAEIPAELWAQHVAQTLDEGRPSDALQVFNNDVEKEFAPSVSAMFPLDSNATGLTPTNGCWTDGGIRRVATGSGTPSNAYSVCSSNGTNVRNFSIDGGCDPVLNQNTTVRTMVFNSGTYDFLAHWCYSTGSQTWQCTADVEIGDIGFYYGTSFYKSGSKHRLGIGFSVPAGLSVASSGYLGTATLNPTGIKRFEDTGCTAFSRNY